MLRNSTAVELQKIIADPNAPSAKVIAAVRVAAARRPDGDVSDFEDFIGGTKTLAQLKKNGIDTSQLRKVWKRRNCKTGEETVAIEMRPSSREDAELVIDTTDGRPHMHGESGPTQPRAPAVLIINGPGSVLEADLRKRGIAVEPLQPALPAPEDCAREVVENQ